MSTLEERQIELEIESVLMGRQRYERRRAEEGESASLPGMEQTRRALPVLADAIAQWITEASAPNRAGRRHSALPFLVHIAPEEAAYLTIRYALDGAAARQQVNTVAVSLGSAVQTHIEIMALADADDAETSDEAKHMRRLFRKVLDQVKKATSASHRHRVWRHVVRKYRREALNWTERNKLLVGLKLIELFEQSCALVRIQRDTDSRNNTPVRLAFTDEAAAWFEEAHLRASLWEPVHQPMLVPPRDWTSPFNGGYLTRAIRAHMVLSHSKGYLDELCHVDMPEVYAAVNTVQRTPWRINRAVLAVMEEARGLGERYRALFVEPAPAFPIRPASIPEGVPSDALTPEQREELISWKRAKSLVHAAQAKERSETAVVAQKLAVARKFAREEAIYFPHYLDFRGRIYPLASYLHPQGDDIARALLEFARGKPLGARGLYWLKIHIANLFGVDKVSFGERVRWTNEHMDELLRCAAAPLDYDFWTTADKPWQALAACFELAGALVQGEDYVSHLPIAMDGTCSGLQHYSAMLRDAEGGAQVNLVPAARPSDIYSTVAARVQSVINASTSGEAAPWRGKVTREIVKQPTMTYCYSVTPYGMAGQIEDKVRKIGKDYLGAGVEVRPAAVYLAGLVRQAIGETVLAAPRAMEFLKSVAVLAAEKGLPIRWTAPSGFPVLQEYREPLGQVVDVMYGGLRLQLTIRKEGSRIDRKKQAAGVAPNFVHSLDAAHLTATVNLGAANGLHDWACIHDAFGVHAADVDILHQCIREAFVAQYSTDVLARFREEIIEQLQSTAPELVERVPPVPPKGSLDISMVRESDYFFS